MTEVEVNQDAAGKAVHMPWQASVKTVFLCILFGANAVAIKISLKGLGVFTTAGVRFSLASLTLFLWARYTGRSLRINLDQAKKLSVVSLLFIVQLSCFYTGLSMTTASRGTLIANLLPFFVLVLAHFFTPGDRITLKKIIGILLGFSGVVFLFTGKGYASQELKSGDLVVLAAVIIWSFSAIYVKRVISGFRAYQITFYPMLVGAPFFFAEALLWDDKMIWSHDAGIIAAVLYQALVTASYGFVAWNGMLQRYGATTVHSFVFIMPLSGVLFGALLLGEPVTFDIVSALVLIAAGIAVVSFSPGQRFLKGPF